MLNRWQLKNRKLELKLSAVFLLIAAVLGKLGWNSYQDAKAYRSAEVSVLTINEQLRASNRFMLALQNTETGQRGYLLTDDEAYLEPYHEGLKHVNVELRQMSELLGNEQRYAPMLEELNRLKAEKLAVMARAIARNRAGDGRGALRIVQEGSGKRTMDGIRAIVDKLLDAKRAEAEAIKSQVAERARRAEYSVKRFIAVITLALLCAYAFVCRDLGARRRLKTELDLARNLDPLTGLANRDYFDKAAANALKHAYRDRSRAAVVAIQVDNFREINERFGYAAGDSLLKDVAARLRETARKNDLIARLFGGEFVMLVPQLENVEELTVLAERILQGLSSTLILAMKDQVIGARIGIAVYPADALDADKLLEHAQAAVAMAKASDDRRYRFFDDGVAASISRLEQVTYRLQTALARTELEVHYQPQLELSTEKVIGVEALLRWHSAELGNVAADEFIPIAEKTGLIIPIGAFVMREACNQAAKWNSRGCNWHLAVNVSAAELREHNYAETVGAALESSGLPAALLELEITEGMLLDEVALAELEKVRALGVNISLDDFGTGYSSLRYLAQFAAHRIKIDKSFVQGVPENKIHCSLVQSIIHMAEDLGIKVVAEGVETEAHAEFLKAAHCDVAQGYLYFRPQSPQDIERAIPCASA